MVLGMADAHFGLNMSWPHSATRTFIHWVKEPKAIEFDSTYHCLDDHFLQGGP